MRNEVRHAITVSATIGAILLGLFVIHEADQSGLGNLRRFSRQTTRPNVYVAGQERPKIRLYYRPDEGRRVGPDNEFRNHYPEIFAARAAVIIFGADWCHWCKEQAKELTEPSHRYNIIYAKIDDEKGQPTRWGKLLDTWALGDSVPVTVLVENGKVTRTWKGYTAWPQLELAIEKAKKNENEQTPDFIIGPIDGGGGERLDLERYRNNRNRR